MDALTGPRRSAAAVRRAIESAARIEISTIVLYEWVRGPRRSPEIVAQEALFPSETAAPFGPREAALSGSIYHRMKKPRGREIDIAIAACAMTRDAVLWTLNPRDFIDIPDLAIYEGPDEG